MIVGRHAVRRLKKHKLVPKHMDGHSAKEYIKRAILNGTKAVYRNRKTGARVHITDTLVAVMRGNTVVTVYPTAKPKEGSHGQLR